MGEIGMDTFAVKVGKVSVDLLDDDRIVLGIKTKKPFEPETLEEWAKACEEGGNVLDVGAYSGLFSIAAAKLGASPIAIEPMPDLVKRIKKNAARNNVAFEVIEAAAGEEAGNVRLGFNDKVHLTSGASIYRKSGGSHVVRMMKLDSLKVSRLAAIKIDVERYEVEVLKGAMNIIAKHKPILIIEVLEESARTAVEKMLPRYRSRGMFDTRNVILEPR